MKLTATPPRITAARVVALLVTMALVGGLAALLGTSLTSRTWTAERQVLVRVWNIDALVLSGQTADVSASDLSDAATIMSSDDVIVRAAGTLDEPEAELAAAVTAVPAQTSAFVELSVTGASAAEADRRAGAVAEAFSSVVQIKVLASARQIVNGLDAGTGAASSDIRVRAQAVGSVDPVQVYSTGGATRSGIGTSTAVAAGAVAGLALAALVVVLLAFAAPRLRRADDVTSDLGVAAALWHDADPTAEDEGLVAQLRAAARAGAEVVVCPATSEDRHRAQAFALWLGGAEPDDAGAHLRAPGGVVLLQSPVDTLPSARPDADEVSSAVLVARAGSRTETVGRAIDLLGRWRPVDAVVLVE